MKWFMTGNALSMTLLMPIIIASAVYVGCENPTTTRPPYDGVGEPPAAPTNLRIHGISQEAFRLTWSDNSGNEDGFEIQESCGSDDSFERMATTAANVDSFVVAGRTPDSLYCYRVRAYNQFGSSNFSNTVAYTAGSPNVSLVSTLPRQTSPALALAFSRDGRFLVSGWGDFRVRLWSWRAGELLWTVYEHDDHVRSIALSPDSIHFASGSVDGTVNIHEIASGRLVRTLEGYTGGYKGLAFDPATRDLAFISREQLRFWKVPEGELLFSLMDLSSMECLAFSPDGNQVAVGVGPLVRVWNLEEGEGKNTVLFTLRGHEFVVNCLTYSPEGNLLASCSADSTVRLWDVTGDGDLVATLREHEVSVYSVAFSPDGRYLASGGWDWNLCIWSVLSLELLQSLEGHEYCIYDVVFTPDGQYLASASGDRTIRIWGPFY